MNVAYRNIFTETLDNICYVSYAYSKNNGRTDMYKNTIALYKNSMTGEVRSYEGWKQWAQQFYTSLGHDELGRDYGMVKHVDVLMPKDWFSRVAKVLRLEPVGE